MTDALTHCMAAMIHSPSLRSQALAISGCSSGDAERSRMRTDATGSRTKMLASACPLSVCLWGVHFSRLLHWIYHWAQIGSVSGIYFLFYWCLYLMELCRLLLLLVVGDVIVSAHGRIPVWHRPAFSDPGIMPAGCRHVVKLILVVNPTKESWGIEALYNDTRK